MTGPYSLLETLLLSVRLSLAPRILHDLDMSSSDYLIPVTSTHPHHPINTSNNTLTTAPTLSNYPPPYPIDSLTSTTISVVGNSFSTTLCPVNTTSLSTVVVASLATPPSPRPSPKPHSVPPPPTSPTYGNHHTRHITPTPTSPPHYPTLPAYRSRKYPPGTENPSVSKTTLPSPWPRTLVWPSKRD